MPKSELTIHPCGFNSRPCDNDVCRRSKRADGSYMRKYYIGDAHWSGHKPVFCEDCIQHMLQNPPPEFVTGGVDLEARLRDEISKAFEEKMQEAVAAERARWETETAALRKTIELLQHPNDADEDGTRSHSALVGAELPAAQKENDGTEFRCLDCGAVFETAHGLIVHRRMKHKSDGKE